MVILEEKRLDKIRKLVYYIRLTRDEYDILFCYGFLVKIILDHFLVRDNNERS